MEVKSTDKDAAVQL